MRIGEHSTQPLGAAPRKAVSFWSAVSLGIGAMVGAGIFALLGQAGALAGSAVYISFLIGGGIALLSGYSFGKLGARYPAAGGIVEYLVQSYGVGFVSSWLSVVLYIAALVALSMIARAFGSYGAAMLGHGDSRVLVGALAAGVVVVLVAVNLMGAQSMARVERWVVVVKLALLGALTVVGMFYLQPELLTPRSYPPTTSILFSVALTFFAYEGFRVITNAAEDMENPGRTLPRAMLTAIAIAIVVYVAVALVVFGNLPASDVAAARDYALAEAARPAFGSAGFKVVAVGALISTASAINANLYAVTNVTYQMAKDGQLPDIFGRPIEHSREGLLVSGAIIIVLSAVLDLGEIATVGSMLILLVHCAVHLGHWHLLKETGASRMVVTLAAITTAAAVAIAGYHAVQSSHRLAVVFFAFVGASLAIEIVLRTRRRIAPRLP